jgi:nitroimidazol reductase NimA-like FMN-containing flavoprotein (pyridoxamine 5'-phosphate oxidase superfamily)
MTSLHRELTELTADDCYALLGTQPVGRLAVPDGVQGPLVVPVNFLLDGDVIVFRTDMGTKVRALRQGPVSFQVDFIDWIHHTGWSVLARGVAYEATHWEVEHLDLDPWAEGDKTHWIRLIVDDITGRRLQPSDLALPTDDRGYL